MVERKRDTRKKRESILAAASSVFVSEGYDGSSMDRIAEIAQASKRTVYNHFPSKEVLFRDVLNRFMSESHELKKIPYQPKHSLEAQLEQFADSMLAITRDPTWLGLMKVMTGVVIRRPELVGETLARVLEEEDTLATWLEAATKDGRLDVRNPSLAAKAFWAMLGGAFLLPAIYGDPMNTTDVDVMKKELIQMLLARYETDVRVPRSGETVPQTSES